MKITVTEEINALRERIWNLISYIDTWSETISGIETIEVIDRPEAGVVGLKWRETRIMFGKEAVETMWISAAEPNHWYETAAHSHGSIYSTRLSLEDSDDKIVLTMSFSAQPTTFVARLMTLFTIMFSGSMRKLLQKDLQDIRRAAESTA